MMAKEQYPDGVFSILDTDLYKLTMQNAVLKFFPNVDVTFKYTNRTDQMFLNTDAFHWLQEQIDKLANLKIGDDEIAFLTEKCPYFTPDYLIFLKQFRFRPSDQVKLDFLPRSDGAEDGQVTIAVSGKWTETILYEIPLLALVSEAYFKFCDIDWNHDGQESKAYDKGLHLCESGCKFSEFGSRRRRDYKTHDLVMQGLIRANKEAEARGLSGRMTGTSNVHFATKYNVTPIGTVAHEWFMGIAAITNDYVHANENGLKYWIGTFGRGTLSIALTDTFGTPDFLKAFRVAAPVDYATEADGSAPSYAQIFAGTRQDSGDPADFVKRVKSFYDAQGIASKDKVIVFSDSLDVEKCIQYKRITEQADLTPSFGIGTFFTNDFLGKQSGRKSAPLNIVIKLSEAGGRPAIKISDNLGKNTGDSKEVERVKKELGYVEKEWEGGDERTRMGEV